MGLASLIPLHLGSFAQQLAICLLFGLASLFSVCKFKSWWLLLAVLGICGSFLMHSLTAVDSQESLTIYPDEVKIKDHYLSGIGRQGGTKVSLFGKVPSNLSLSAGQAYQISSWEGKITKIAGPRNFGQFDYQRYALAQSQAQAIELKTGRWQAFSCPALHQWKFCVQTYLQHLPPYLSFFAQELLLGKANDELKIKDNYRQLGIIHLLSLSGLHVSLYCLLISTLGYRCHLTEEEVACLCGLILTIGLFLSGWQPGFVRAGISYGLRQISQKRRWPLPACDLLGLTLAAHLCLQPRLFLNVGAQLSYLLAWGMQLTGKRPLWQQGLLLNWLIAPVLLANFYGLNWLTFAINLVLVPYFNWWVMPLTFAGVLLAPLRPLCELCLSLTEKGVAWLAATNLGWLSFGKLAWWQEGLLLVLTIWWLVWFLPVKHQPSWCWHLLAIYGLCFAALHFPLNSQVTFIDVGQGDSILLTTPGKRHAYLIDTGGRLAFGHRKRPAQILQTTLPYLQAQGISHLNGVFLSHQDADHIGDLRSLLIAMPVDHLYFAAGLQQNPHFRKQVKGLLALTKLHPLLAGDQLNLSPQLQMQVVWPKQPGPGRNEDSLCLLAVCAGKRWLFTGDLDRAHERVLARQGLQADYLKLGHHGSRTASDPSFLKSVHPSRVFISAGVDNRYGHPHPETLQTLRQLGLPADNTADCGMISWTKDLLQHERLTYMLKEPKK